MILKAAEDELNVADNDKPAATIGVWARLSALMSTWQLPVTVAATAVITVSVVTQIMPTCMKMPNRM